jgi:hypothetical protein
LFNTTLASTSQVVFPSSGAIKNSFVRATRLNGVSGLAGIKSWFPYGTITPDTTYYKTASPSQRLTPSSASAKLESGKKQFAIASGQTATVTVWVRKSAAYNGNQPRLVLKANPAVGVNSDTIMATMSGGVDVDVGPGNFTQLSGTTPAASQDGVMEVVVDCDGTAGFVNVDLWGFA